MFFHLSAKHRLAGSRLPVFHILTFTIPVIVPSYRDRMGHGLSRKALADG